MIYLGGFLVLSILVNVFLLVAINSRDKEIVFLNQIYLSCESQLSKTLKELEQLKSTIENDLEVDCISREQALNEFCIYNPYDSIGVDKVRSYLKALPSVTPQELRWIPVNERLPENDSFYLVTEKSGRVCTYVFHKGNSEEYWKRCTVAWMLLPKPYEPQESEDKE